MDIWPTCLHKLQVTVGHFLRVSKLVALTAYRLLVVVYYSAPLIANLERVGDGWLV